MLLKLTFPIVAALGSLLMAGYLYLTDQLSRELAFVLFGIVLIAFWLFFRYEKPYITYDEARQIAYDKAMQMQAKGEFPAGTLRLSEETGRKDILMSGEHGMELVPRKWIVGIMIEGNQTKAYFIDIDAFGNVLETSENDEPTSWRVYEIDDIRKVDGYSPTPEEAETGAFEKEERAKGKRERIKDRKRPNL